jgi:phenol hydroxylase P1 protein
MTIDLQAREIKPLRNTYSHIAHYIGEEKHASRYEEATLGAQSTANFHYRPTWDPDHELYDPSRSAVKLADWYVLRDPRQFYYGAWTTTRARQQDAMESTYQFVEQRGLVAKTADAVRAKACDVLMPLRHVAWGGNTNNCAIAAYGYGAAFTAPSMFHAMDHLGVAQYLTRLGLALDEPGVLEAGLNAWLQDPRWQVLRRYVEDTFVLKDPFELFVAQNLALDGQLYPLIYNVFVDDHLAAVGGSALAMLTAFMPDWHDESSRWVDAVVKTAAAESDANRKLIGGWVALWSDRAKAALAPVADLALGAAGETALADARAALDARIKTAGLA